MKENPKYKGVFLDGERKGEEFVDWKSRSIASTVVVMSEENLTFLVTKRGPGCPDNIGKYVFSCGYLNWGETVRDGAIREVYEETGLRVEPEEMMCAGWNDLPSENRENVTFRWLALVSPGRLDSLSTDSEQRGGEAEECSEIRTMTYQEILERKDEFAFGHADLAKTIVENLEGIKTMQPLIQPLLKYKKGDQ